MHGHAESSIACNMTQKAFEVQNKFKKYILKKKKIVSSQGWSGYVIDPTGSNMVVPYKKKESVGGIFYVSCHTLTHTSPFHFMHFDLRQN